MIYESKEIITVKLNSPVVMMAMEKKFMCPTTLSEVALNVV